MDLYLWLAKKRILKTEFSKRLGISRTHLHRIMSGYAASKDLIQKIVEETNGEVGLYDIRPDLKKTKKRQKGPKIKQLDAFE